MRKTLFTIFGVILMGSLGLAANAAVGGASSDMVATLFNKAKVEDFGSKPEDLSDLSLSKNPFENLYLFMYRNVKLYPRQVAISELAKSTVYSEEEIEKIVVQGDFTPLYSYFNEEKQSITQELVGREYLSLQKQYADELNFQLENYTLSYDAIAKEIFMNGDTGDSANIDLLFDLDIIHYLLFGTFIEPVDRSGGEKVQLASESTTLQRIDDVLLASVDFPICNGDASLADSIKEFEDYIASLPSHPASNDVIGSSNGNTQGSGNGSTSNFVSGNTVSATSSSGNPDRIIQERPGIEDFVKNLSGVKGDWSREIPCTEIFCITVEYVTPADDEANASKSYQPEDNCVACHLSFILQRMEQTLSKSLVPGKIPMNAFEDGTCKEAGTKVNLDLNVYVVKKPILLDPDVGLEELPNKNVENLKKTLLSIGGLSLNEKKRSNNVIDFEKLNYFHGNGTQADLLAETLVQQEIRANEISEAYAEFLNKSRGENSLILYEQLAAELYAFSNFFSTFQEQLQATYITDDAPLSKLTNKNYCI